MKRIIMVYILISVLFLTGCESSKSYEKESQNPAQASMPEPENTMQTTALTSARADLSAWICPACGRENNDQFCLFCGHARPETIVCPGCGNEYQESPDLLFCGECGTQLREEINITVTASIQDGLPAHTIIIPGENGSSIYIRELHASYPVTDGYAVIETADHIWYDYMEDLSDETMEVTLTPFINTASGSQKHMSDISYTIEIPTSPIMLETPETMRTTVATAMANIKIIVRPGSRVTINGNDYSDTVDSQTGEMTYNANVQPIGDNTYNITVRSQYCRENTIQVILYREPQEIPLDLAAGTYGTTNKNVMKVTATTLPGAGIEVTTPYTDLDISALNTTGKFSFNAVFDHYGDNTISITASYPGKKSSRVDHTVYYVPDVDEYTRKAWALDPGNYSDLLNTIALRASKNQVYVIKGIVQYSISDKPQMVVINSSDDGKSQPVMLENKSNIKKWEVGKYYRIYADAYSTYNSMPYLIARYAYEK